MNSGAAHLQAIRAEELKAVFEHMPAPPLHILEIGGGDGYQASLLSASGFEVESVDIASDALEPFFDVKIYDGRTLPFGAREFDCVFSSNVLEHVRDLEAINGEIRRVLKPDGMAIHVLPSSAWRFWTSIAHYPYILKVLLSGTRSIPTYARLPTAGEALKQRGVVRRVARALFPQPHGEYASSLTELYTYSKGRWTRVFSKYGFDVVAARPTGVFGTGYGLLVGPLPIAARRRLAGVLGSAAHVFVLRARAV